MPSRASKRWNVPKSIARFLVLGFLLNVLVSYAIWVIAWQFYDFTHPGAQAYTQTQSIDSPGYQHERWEGQAFGLSGLWSVTNTETPPGISLREQQALLDSGAPSVTGVTLTGIQTTELIYGWPFRSIGWKSSDSIVTVFDSQLQKFETRQSKTRSPNWFFGGITLGLRWPGSILPINPLYLGTIPNTLICATTMYLCTVLYTTLYKASRRSRAQCPDCAYQLNDLQTCPECGHPSTDSTPA